jgi:hypothetical protein
MVGFNKCGHTSAINTFVASLNHTDPPPQRVKVINSADVAALTGSVRGDLTNFQDWPEPHTIVALIRSPITRIVSAYHHLMVRTQRYNFIDLGFQPGCSFDEFLDHLATIDLTKDAHTASYGPDLLTAGADKHKTIIIPLEEIDTAWPAVLTRLGMDDVPTEMWHKNKSPESYEFPNYPQFKKIHDVYLNDYNLWEYVLDETRASLPTINYIPSERLIRLVNQ